MNSKFVFSNAEKHCEVHVKDCPEVDKIKESNLEEIGLFDSHVWAIVSAKYMYPDKIFDGCGHCSDPRHMHTR